MGDIAVENYKKSVTRFVDDWVKDAMDIVKQLKPIKDELDKLEDESSPGADQKKRIAELTKKSDLLHTKMDEASLGLKLEIIDLKVDPQGAEQEIVKIPPWMKDIIKRKGVPLGKDITIAPTAEFDFKAKKLKSFGIKVTW